MNPRVLMLWIGLSSIVPGTYGFERGTPSDEITGVSSRVFNGYKRTMLADGSLRPETYGFAIGGYLRDRSAGVLDTISSSTRDESVDDIRFATLAKIIEVPLSEQKYLPTGEPKAADLLIVVFWGRTVGSSAFSGSDMKSAGGSDQDLIDARNARLLGFNSSRVFDQGFGDPANMMANIRREVYAGVLDAIKEDRYFVILQAFDFQAAWKRKAINLLWETRFSIAQRQHDFEKDLPRMAKAASAYFGRDSHGLVREAVPEGRVNIGDVQSLGPLPERDSGVPMPKP